MRRLMLALLVAAVAAPTVCSAQVLRGHVVDSENRIPLPTALVRLLDGARSPVAMSIADSLGTYRIEAPAPGQYFVSVERLGYETFVSHLIEMENPDGVYPVDLEMLPDPVALRDLMVQTERFAAIRRRVRTLIGMNPSSLRVSPMMRPRIQEHTEKGHDLEDIIRWENLPGITVKSSTDGPCFQYRSRGCVEVYLDGVHVNPELVPILPLDLVETIVVVMPLEAISYEGGGILLYTSGWIG